LACSIAFFTSCSLTCETMSNEGIGIAYDAMPWR
jgi:hypothetical protein